MERQSCESKQLLGGRPVYAWNRWSVHKSFLSLWEGKEFNVQVVALFVEKKKVILSVPASQKYSGMSYRLP